MAVENVDCGFVGFDAVQSYQRLHGVTSLNITIDRLPLIADFCIMPSLLCFMLLPLLLALFCFGQWLLCIL
jgi:uncharacterized membrane protein